MIILNFVPANIIQMRIRIIVTSIAIMFFSSIRPAFSQNDDKTFTSQKAKHFFTGGTLGLQFGTQTVIDVSPIIGYMITKRLAAGVGITYKYFRQKDQYNIFKTSIYGGSLFSRLYLFKNVFLHGEYELLNLESDYFSIVFQPTERFWVGSVLAGAGYSEAISEKSSLYLMILYNFNESINSPYANPVFRAGINLGF